MSSTEIANFFGTVGLFSGMATPELEEVARAVRPFERSGGEALFHQGEVSDGMYIIRRGTVEIRSRVPGDSTVTLAQLHEGDLLGEVSLLDRGVRSATAVAVGSTEGYWLGRRHFEVLRHDMKPASLTLMRRLIANTCASVRRSYARIASLAPSSERAPSERIRATLETADATTIPLDALPFFSSLTDAGRRNVLDMGRVVAAPRGAFLFREGDHAEHVYFVLRGAARIVLERTAPALSVAVLAPGCVAGLVGSLDGGSYGTSGFAAESSHLLRLPRQSLEQLQSEATPRSWHLSEHLHDNLVSLLRRCTDHASRLELERHLRARKSGGPHV